MIHLLNCHGEWLAMLAILPSLPLLGPWLHAKLRDPQDRPVDRAFIGVFGRKTHQRVLDHRPKLIALLLVLILINLAVLMAPW